MRKLIAGALLFCAAGLFGLDLLRWEIVGVHKEKGGRLYVLQKSAEAGMPDSGRPAAFRLFYKDAGETVLEYLEPRKDNGSYFFLRGKNKFVLFYKNVTKNTVNEKINVIFIDGHVIENKKARPFAAGEDWTAVDLAKSAADDAVLVTRHSVAPYDGEYYLGTLAEKNVYRLFIIKRAEKDGTVYFTEKNKMTEVRIAWDESGKATGVLTRGNKKYDLACGFIDRPTP